MIKEEWGSGKRDFLSTYQDLYSHRKTVVPFQETINTRLQQTLEKTSNEMHEEFVPLPSTTLDSREGQTYRAVGLLERV